MAPFVTEEVWKNMGRKESVHLEAWPEFDPEMIKVVDVTIGVQINGKVRDSIDISAEASEEEAVSLAQKSEKIQKYLSEGELRKVIYIPGKILNLIVN